MKCKQVEPEIEAYAIGALPLEEMQAIKDHLENCASCAALLREYNLTVESLALEAGLDFEPLEGHTARFQAKLSQRTQLRPGSANVEELTHRPKLPNSSQPSARQGWWGRFAPAGLALTLVLLLGLGLWSLSLQSQLEQERNQNRAVAAQLSLNLNQVKELNEQLSNEKDRLVSQATVLNGENGSLKQQVSQLRVAEEADKVAQNVSLLLTRPGATTRTATNDKFGVTVLMAPQERDVALFAHSWPELKPGEVYHVWLYHTTGQLISGGSLKLTPLPAQNLAEAIIGVPEPMANYTTLFVTIEKPGAQQPNGLEIVRDKLA